MNSLSKRLRQLAAVLRHPGNLASKYDTPWDNGMYGNVREMYATNQLESCFLEDLLVSWSNGEQLPSPVVEHVFESDASGGSVTPFELRALAAISGALNPRTILEIGTFEGRTTRNLALNAAVSEVYTMCLPQEQCTFEVGKFFANTPQAHRIKQIFGDSRQFDFSTLPPMDLVFIDGDHSYDAVRIDTRNAFKVLESGGVVVWHDFDRCHLATTAAILEEVKQEGCSYRWLQGTSLAVGFYPDRMKRRS